MKKFCLFFSILVLLFSSCTENLENQDTQQKSGNVIIKIKDTNSSSRFFSPVDSIDISKVEEWKLTFTSVAPKAGEKSEFTLKDEQNSVTLGVGIYNFYIEGSYTLDSDTANTIMLAGSKENITIVENGTATLSVLVGLKKTEAGEGEISFSFEFDDSADNGTSWTNYYTDYGTKNADGTTNYSNGIKVILVSRKDKTEYSTENGYLKFVDVVDNSDSDLKYLKFSNDNKIPSGYYYLELFADYSNKNSSTGSAVSDAADDWRKISFNSASLIEIADDQTTVCDFVNLSFPNSGTTTYTYYASDNGSEDSNGLSSSNPGTLNNIIENIYANKALTEATINYTYSDKLEFDVSKIQTGKEITFDCKQADDSSKAIEFIVNSDGSAAFVSFNDQNGISLTTTDETKKVFSIDSLSGYSLVCLNDGVYLDLCSLPVDDQNSPTIYFNVYDIEYYKNNPMVVKPEEEINVSLKFKEADFSEYQEQTQLTVFTYEFSVKQNSEGLYEVYAQEPSPVHILYYGNESNCDTGYYIGNDTKSFQSDSSSIASWCDDGEGGIYIFKAKTQKDSTYYTYNQLVDSPNYNITHYKKIESDDGTSFILKTEEINYPVNNVPVSMCTDGAYIYYVESVLDISGYGGKKFNFGTLGSWVHKDYKVKYFSINNTSQTNELDFSSIFTDGKVTSVYYYNNELYVAGYKKESIGSITNENNEKTEFFDSTYSVYKLSDSTDVNTATCVSEVFKNSTENDRAISLLEDYNATSDRIKSYNAIIDMAIMDGKLYVLENSYYYASGISYISKGSLRQISIETGKVLNIFDKSNTDSSGRESFVVPNKILAVLPKKLELVIADSAKDNNSTGASYRVNLSDSTTDITEEFQGSNYYFDKYSVGSDFFNSTSFGDNAYYTSKTASEEFDD